MNILMVYPRLKLTFWNYRDIVRKFLGRRAAFTPAGLLQLAKMLPESWSIKLVDLNVEESLGDEVIKWADSVWISAMATQEDSAREVIALCKKFGKPVVLGGPILEMGCDKFSGVSAFFLGEAEETVLQYLADVAKNEVKRIYSSPLGKFPDLAKSRASSWDLINPHDYASPMVQIGRGCPYSCTFCDVAHRNGRVPRFRPERTIFTELDGLYETGYREAVFVADDNIIGNKNKAKKMLAKLAEWQRERGYPFEFTGEFDIILADDEELMDVVVAAGFKKVFLGLETFSKASLVECGKLQNLKHANGTPRDLVADVKKIQRHGLIPMSGFIVGFDSDDPATFARTMIGGIQQSGITIAMVGVLQAPPGSKLHSRLGQECRLTAQASGNNTDWEPNFIPKMPLGRLAQGYKRIWETIYSPKEFYKTIREFLESYDPSRRPRKEVSLDDFKAFMRANLWIGLLGGLRVSYYYWRSLSMVFFSKKRLAFPDVVAMQIYRAHFRKLQKEFRELDSLAEGSL